MIWFLALVLVPVRTHLIDTPHNITSPCTDRNHFFFAPGVLTAGGSSRACVSRFYPEGPARMQLNLQTEDGEVTTAMRELPPGDGGCLDINVPQKPNTKAELNINLRYPEANCVWSGRLSLRIAGSKVVVVHTERARYRPGDIVRLRALALKADLTPAHGNIDEIWIEGPRGIWDGARAAQWLRVRTRLGLAQIQYQLDELAPPGKWLVKARLLDGSQGSATFSVGNYDLPPFQLTVRHAPRVLRTSERLVWTVCVRYPWSEAVEGMLVIRLRGAGMVSDSTTGIRTAVRLKAPRPCHRHAAAARRIGLNGVSAPSVVVADFSFQEEGTRVWQNTTVVSQVVDGPITLEFVTKYRSVISPGLPYKLKVKATRWDDKPAVNEQVRVCRTPVTSQMSEVNMTSTANATCVDALTDVRGIAGVLFNPEENACPSYIFKATLNNATSTLQLPCRGAASKAALGPLRADSRTRTLVPLYLNLGNVSSPLTVHFVVITRSGIIYRWGATTQCPVTSNTNQIQTAPRKSNCLTRAIDTSFNEIQRKNLSDVDALLERHLLRVMLPIKVSNQMCPDSRVVAYFYHDGELVSTSKHFEMEECFGNKVEATWLSRQVLPGSMSTIQLSTPGPALCALSVLDITAKWLQPGDSIKDMLMLALKRLIDAHRNLTEHDAGGECFLTTDTPEPPTTSSALMLSWLASAGVRVSGGEAVHKCDPGPAALLSDDVFTARSDFSEAWLWRLVAVGSNGSASTTARAPDSITRFEANAYCLSRTGVAIAPPAVLQVFREFFIHADGPRRLQRGDRSVIRYRLFNYLYTPVCVEIQILTDPHVETNSSVERACIAGRSSAARRLELRARLAGEARVSVRAVPVDDPACRNCTAGPPISDEVLIKIQIEQEGVPVQEHKSIMLCATGTEGMSTPQSISWSWPSVPAVPGTESLKLWAVGDVTGPMLANADGLVTLPRGCGEQNMARLATNLLALSQLDPRSSAHALAKDHVARGFIRQLQYVHPEGGFSAFGPTDSRASTWLTAFCVRYLRRAYRVLSPGLPTPPALERAERWLRAQQMENGCFRNDGQLFHRELKGGLTEDGEIASIAVTAYVVTSLIESAARVPADVIRNALSCLRAFPPQAKPARTYAHAVLAYAFVRIKRYEEELKRTNEAALLEKKGLEEKEETHQLMELLKIARQSGNYVWWESATLASSIEATGYALLALRECAESLRAHCAAAARGAALWLATHRSATGGFVATQDTLVALEGLSRWSSLQVPASNLTVRARSSQARRAITLLPGAKVPEFIDVEPASQLNVDVEGVGCALVQATRSYNTLCAGGAGGARCAGGGRGVLTVQVAVRTDGPFDCTANDTLCYCAAVVQACVVWSGQLPEMALLEVVLPGGYGADAAKLYEQLHKSDLMLRRIELTPSGTKATLYLSGSNTLERSGHRCYDVHATGPRAATGPQHVSVMDYYAPHTEHSQMYVIPEDCPAPISHETQDYNPTDNLFTKARSLTDDGEILITHEFSFEDIPEGVPLDDPMYESLTQKKEVKNDGDSNDTLIAINYTDLNDRNVAISWNTVGNRGNEIYKNSSEFEKINQSELIKNTNISNEEAVVKNNLKFAKYSDNELHKDVTLSIKNNNRNKISATHFTDHKQKSRDIEAYIQHDSKTEVKQTNVNKNRGNVENTTVHTNKDNVKAVNDKLQVDNPMLSTFHVIDSEKDLDVPSGVEGPVPTVVLPPGDFVFIPPATGVHFTPHPEVSRRHFPRIPMYSEPFFQPYYNYPNYRSHRNNSPFDGAQLN